MKIRRTVSILLAMTLCLTAFTGCNASKESSKAIQGSDGRGLYNGYSKCSLLANSSNLAGTVGDYAVSKYNGALGYGYNIVTKNYFNPTDINHSYHILDPVKLSDDNMIYSYPITDDKSYNVTGTTVEEYEKDLSAHASVSTDNMFFKGDFQTSFTTSTEVSTISSFVKTFINDGKAYEYIDLSKLEKVTDLEKYFSPSFKKDIDNIVSTVTDSNSIDNKIFYSLFNNYGTHLLTDIEIGGRMELNYFYENTKKQTQRELKISAEESYKSITAGQDITISDNAKSLQDNSTFLAHQIGGTCTTNISTITQACSSYDTWSKSLESKDARLDLMGVGDVDNQYALIPIWNLISDEKTKNACESAYNDYLNQNGNSYFKGINTVTEDNGPYVQAVFFGNDSGSRSKAISNLKTAMQNDYPSNKNVVFENDLNYDADGDYIYMGYVLTNDKSQALTDLKLDYRKNDDKDQLQSKVVSNGRNYEKYNLDLTKGTGGDYYITLYYTKDTANGASPIREIGLENGDGNYTFSDMTNWTSVGTFNGVSKLDINKGAGGRNIYIWQKH